MEDRLLFIDVETGGLDPDKHSLLSVALVAWENGEIIDSREWLINDGIMAVTEEALAINRINIEEHQRSALPPSQALEKMLSFISTHFPQKGKITLAGHNVQFDVSFLKVFFANNNKDLASYFSHRIIDTSSILYYLYLAGKTEQRATSSDKAFELFDIEVEGRHTALGDAIATAKLFTRLLQLTK